MTLRELRRRLAHRTPRERRLLAAAAAVIGSVVTASAVVRVAADLRALEARIADGRSELATVRTLARQLDASAGQAGSPPLPARIEQAAEAIVGRDRLAAMTPAVTPDGRHVVAVRITDAALPDVVALLHAWEGGAAPLTLTRLDIQRRPGAGDRFDVTADIAGMEHPS